jgi:hypothetical protein
MSAVAVFKLVQSLDQLEEGACIVCAEPDGSHLPALRWLQDPTISRSGKPEFGASPNPDDIVRRLEEQ